MRASHPIRANTVRPAASGRSVPNDGGARSDVRAKDGHGATMSINGAQCVLGHQAGPELSQVLHGLGEESRNKVGVEVTPAF
jgi:hypothetical protein